MNAIWKSGLLAGTSLGLLSGMAHAQGAGVTDAAASDVVVVVGSGRTYSSNETTREMANQQAPLTSVLAQIDNLPGVHVTEGDQFGFDDWSTGVAIRGFQSNLSEQQIGITIDGLPNGNSNYGGGSKANRYIDTQNLGGIIVSQGTADIASRSNEALGGTLNFTTRDPLDEARATVSGAYGDFDAKRAYVSYDTGLIGNTDLAAWFSVSTQSATDWVNQSAENERDHFAAKIAGDVGGWGLTAYLSFDETHEDNYEQLYSEAEWEENKEWDRLIDEWTSIPYVNQMYRKGWSTLRENGFAYLQVERELFDGFTLNAGAYRHDQDGRGDWLPPYVVDIIADTGAESELSLSSPVQGGAALGRLFFVDAAGEALSPDPTCESTITFPYGGAGPEYDPGCYPATAIPVQSYRHTHYQKERTGFTADADWTANFGNIDNTLRVGLWYEDATRYEYRDWHLLTDARVGYEYDETAYWQQYSVEFPQTTFKWYAEDSITFGDITVRGGVKQFNNEVERMDVFAPANAFTNFSVESDSDLLWSGGVSYQPAFADGLELFAGYAENFKSISDAVVERTGTDTNGNGVVDAGEEAPLPDPETAENWEVGARYVGSRVRGSLTYFNTTFEDRLFFLSNTTVAGPDYLVGTSGSFFNAGGIESQGVEVAAQILINENWSVYSSYTYNDSTYIGTGDPLVDAAQGITPGNRVTGIPENMFVLSTDFERGYFFGGVSAKFVGDRFVDVSNSWVADDHLETDLYLGVQLEAFSDALDSFEARLTVNNVLDEDYLGGISGNAAWIASPRTAVLTVTAGF